MMTVEHYQDALMLGLHHFRSNLFRGEKGLPPFISQLVDKLGPAEMQATIHKYQKSQLVHGAGRGDEYMDDAYKELQALVEQKFLRAGTSANSTQPTKPIKL